MKNVSLVATVATVRKFFPDVSPPRPHAKTGVLSAPFPVDAFACKTKFGTWLAERTITTRRDDDLSILRVTVPATEEELHVRAFAKSLAQNPVRTAAMAEQLHQRMLEWIAERQKVLAAYGDRCFDLRTVHFDWPVFGSVAGGGLESPEAYFDLCAKLIRQMNPVVVKTWNNETPPESYGVCDRSSPRQDIRQANSDEPICQ